MRCFMRAGALLRFTILPAERTELTTPDRDGMPALGLVVLMERRCSHRLAAKRAASLRDLLALVFVTRNGANSARLLRFREQVDELVRLGVEGRFMRVHAEKVGPAFINFR